MDLHEGYGHLYLAWNEPAVAPPGECLPTTATFRRPARRTGLTEPSLYDSDEELAGQLLDSGHPHLTGITLDRLRKEGFARLSVPGPFVPYAEGFPTPSGRLEFVSARAERAGHGALPGYRPPAEVVNAARAERYPLAMISAASHHFLNSVFGNNAELRRRAGRPRAVLHPADAGARGLADGDLVSVGNERGGFEAVVEVSDRVRPGVVATTKGHWAKFNGGASATAAV